MGGSETYVRGLLGEFARGNGPERVTMLVNRHGEPAYASLAGGPLQLEVVRAYRAGDADVTRALGMAYGLARPGRVARALPPGIDAMHFPLTTPIPRTGHPSVVTLHDLQHIELPDYFPRAERLLRRFAYERAARQADVVVTISAHTRDMLGERLGVGPEGVVVAPHGVDHERFRVDGPDDERLLAELDLPGRFLIYPANLWPHKNHRRLLEALAQASDRDVALVLTGNPYGRLDKLMAHAEALGVAGRVRHLGFVGRDVLPALLRRARAMVFPSRFEGFGQPPLEAMACGCAVASSTRGALAEVCAGAALDLDPESTESIAAAIDALASDDRLVDDLRARGPERARPYTWARSAELHTAAYRQALLRRA